MKGRDSPHGQYYPAQGHLPITLPPSSFLWRRKRLPEASGQGSHLGGSSLGWSTVQLTPLQGKVHDDRRTEGHLDQREIVKCRLESWCQCGLLQAELRASWHALASVVAFTALLWLFVCLPLPRRSPQSCTPTRSLCCYF